MSFPENKIAAKSVENVGPLYGNCESSVTQAYGGSSGSRAEEDEDLVVDLSSGSLQATSMRNWRLLTGVLEQLEKL